MKSFLVVLSLCVVGCGEKHIAPDRVTVTQPPPAPVAPVVAKVCEPFGVTHDMDMSAPAVTITAKRPFSYVALANGTGAMAAPGTTWMKMRLEMSKSAYNSAQTAVVEHEGCRDTYPFRVGPPERDHSSDRQTPTAHPFLFERNFGAFRPGVTRGIMVNAPVGQYEVVVTADDDHPFHQRQTEQDQERVHVSVNGTRIVTTPDIPNDTPRVTSTFTYTGAIGYIELAHIGIGPDNSIKQVKVIITGTY